MYYVDIRKEVLQELLVLSNNKKNILKESEGADIFKKIFKVDLLSGAISPGTYRTDLSRLWKKIQNSGAPGHTLEGSEKGLLKQILGNQAAIPNKYTYQELLDEFSERFFSKEYNSLAQEQQDAIDALFTSPELMSKELNIATTPQPVALPAPKKGLTKKSYFWWAKPSNPIVDYAIQRTYQLAEIGEIPADNSEAFKNILRRYIKYGPDFDRLPEEQKIALSNKSIALDLTQEAHYKEAIQFTRDLAEKFKVDLEKGVTFWKLLKTPSKTISNASKAEIQMFLEEFFTKWVVPLKASEGRVPKWAKITMRWILQFTMGVAGYLIDYWIESLEEILSNFFKKEGDTNPKFWSPEAKAIILPIKGIVAAFRYIHLPGWLGRGARLGYQALMGMSRPEPEVKAQQDITQTKKAIQKGEEKVQQKWQQAKDIYNQGVEKAEDKTGINLPGGKPKGEVGKPSGGGGSDAEDILNR